jgi:hypothetical protein
MMLPDEPPCRKIIISPQVLPPPLKALKNREKPLHYAFIIIPISPQSIPTLLIIRDGKSYVVNKVNNLS